MNANPKTAATIRKLLTLALDPAATEKEAELAAVKAIEAARSAGMTPADIGTVFASNSSPRPTAQVDLDPFGEAMAVASQAFVDSLLGGFRRARG